LCGLVPGGAIRLHPFPPLFWIKPRLDSPSTLPALPPQYLRAWGDNVIIIGVARASWSVEFHPACEAWANGLNRADAEALLAAIKVLRDEGPNLGRPLVDSVKASRHANMKELRPGSTGRTEIRVLFAFDKERKAILLAGGDKSEDWKGWYKDNIPIADARFDEHQAGIEKARVTKTTAHSKSQETKGRGRR